MLVLLYTLLVASSDAAAGPLEILRVDPLVIGSKKRTQVTIVVRPESNLKLVDNSVQLFHVEEKKGEAEIEVLGEALCTLLDNGDSRGGDEKAGDGIYSCIAWVEPTRPGKVSFVVQLKSIPGRGVKTGPIIAHSKVFFLTSLGSSVMKARIDDPIHDTVMAEAKKIWLQSKARFGKTDRAQAVAVREIKEIDGVADASLSRSGDIFIDFIAGGRDQFFTFEPQQE